MFEYDTNLGNKILKNPEEALDELDEWILNVQENLIGEIKEKTMLKSNIHARVYGLPVCPELHRDIFPRNEDLDLFLQVTGALKLSSCKLYLYNNLRTQLQVQLSG